MVMALKSFLLHCNASNRVDEILKYDKILERIGGPNALASPLQILAPMIYGHAIIDSLLYRTSSFTDVTSLT